MSEVFSERTVKARKDHRCDTCRKRINAGEQYVRYVGMSDGEFTAVALHPDCLEAERKFNSEAGNYSCDDWYPLCEYMDEPDYRKQLIVEFPKVAERMRVSS